MSATPQDSGHSAEAERAPSAQDVIVAFFGVSWAASVARGKIMPDDRLVDALLDHPRVRRLIVADPYRSVLGPVRARLKGETSPEFPETPERTLYAPLRLRRTDPVRPEPFVARYEAGLRRLAARRGLHRPAVIAAHPLLAGFGDFRWAGPVTYYGWDDWTASRPHERWWGAYDAAFARMRATRRRVVAVSDGILERVAPTGPSAVIPNGIDPAEWLAPGEAPEWFRGSRRPRYVYAGSLDARVDVAQLGSLAAAEPEASIVLVGPMIDEAHFGPLRAHANVTIGPPLGRAAITGLISAADACLIPHVRNDLTRSMSPLKLFEYLAAGRPVAAVDLAPIASVDSPRVVLVPEGGDFAAAARQALALGPAGESERRAFIAANRWAQRFDGLLDLALAD